MNQSDFAKLHAVSRKTVTGWKARGWLVFVGDDIDVEASNKLLERHRKTVTRPGLKLAKNDEGNKSGNKAGNRQQGNKPGNKPGNKKSGNTPDETPTQIVERMIASSGASMSFDEARTLKENFLALLTQLEYEEKRGQLLPWDDIATAVNTEYSRVRTRLIALAPEHGPRLRGVAATTDDAGFVAALQELIYEALNELTIDQRDKPA